MGDAVKHVFVPTAVIAMLLSAAGWGQAQATFNRPATSDPYQSGLKLYYKTWLDLNTARSAVVPYPGDWYRFDQALGQMDLLERTWRDGSFTQAQLNGAIDDVRFVLRVNNLSESNRQALEQDLNQLRDVRLRYGQ
jgi:hypothetical protein